jgi:AcrR family transcriptional regulator
MYINSMLLMSTWMRKKSSARDYVAAVHTAHIEWLPMRKRKPYHHGNLREELLDAAIRLIAEVGPTAFTLREIARRAGVSHNAPYRHFRDKDDVMAAVATQGYRELNTAMLEAAKPETDAIRRLKCAGSAYIAFALRRPEHFTVMFDAPISTRTNPEAAEAGERAFGTLVSLVKNCQEAEQLPPGDTQELALLAWSMVHGIAKLAITGRLPYSSRPAILKFAEFVMSASLPVPNK